MPRASPAAKRRLCAMPHVKCRRPRLHRLKVCIKKCKARQIPEAMLLCFKHAGCLAGSRLQSYEARKAKVMLEGWTSFPKSLSLPLLLVGMATLVLACRVCWL